MIERENTQHEVQDTYFINQLELLDKSIADPYVEHVVRDARLYNQLFSESMSSDAEKQDAINDLDRRWSEVAGSEVKVTGSVLIPTIHGTVKSVIVDELTAVTNGFGGRTEPQMVGGEKIGEVFRIGHYLQAAAEDVVDAGYLTLEEVGFDADDEDSVERFKTLQVTFSADIDQSIVELGGVSYERARSWIDVSCPGLLDELDGRLLNEIEGGNDPIYALKGLDLSEYSAVDDEFTQTCIETHLSDMMRFDTSVPYDLTVDGQMLGYTDERGMTIYQVDDMRALAYMNRVYIVTNPMPQGEDRVWQLAVEVQFLGSAADSPVREFVVPLDSIEGVQSLRQNFYSN